MFRSVETFLRPQTIAIVGASETGGAGWPKGIYENFAHEDFPARVYLVNPRRDELWGRKVYPDFASLPERIDLAIVIIPAEAIVDVLSEAAEARLRNALIFASRFGEGGDDDGAARAAALRDICDRTGLRISGPNCMHNRTSRSLSVLSWCGEGVPIWGDLPAQVLAMPTMP